MRSETPKAVRQVGIGDAGTIRAATEVLSGKSKKKFIGRVLPFLGPAFIACVAYIDPGNFATNIQGGARFGYMLVWVIVASNLMAMLIQTLSAKLGIATGFNLAEMCRERFPQPVVWGMWVLSEVVAMATDLAEFVGAAIGFQLLFGIPFALIPLVMFTRRKDVMGVLVNHRLTTVIASVIAMLIISLNIFLLYRTFFGG